MNDEQKEAIIKLIDYYRGEACIEIYEELNSECDTMSKASRHIGRYWKIIKDTLND